MTSKLAEMQARFQQKQIQEREEKLLRLYEDQQQRAFERVGRGSAGSNTSLGSTGGGGKVRQMFDERRKAGVDRSHPLEPLKPAKPPNGRGGSVDRLKNTTTVVKSQRTTVNQFQSKSSKGATVTKRQIVNSVYNNNNGDTSYEEHRYEDDNEIGIGNRPGRDIVDMMNNHNLNGGCLDDEEMPTIGFDEVDEPYFATTAGKLANVGGKLPSETVAKVEEKKPAPRANLGKTFRKETKPIVKRTVKPAVPHHEDRSSPSLHSQPARVVSSPVSSPVRSASQTMQKPGPDRRPSSKTATPSHSARVPNSSRPSAKQSVKSTVTRDDLTECRYCNRRFETDRLQVHEGICGKTAKKKRKVYDATKHRVEGTELEQYVIRKGRNVSTKTKQSSAPASKKDWRRTHEEFISAIRAAKVAQAHLAKGGKLSDLPPPPPSSNPDYVQCPHCGRKFNESAAERHIPKCASYNFNKPKAGSRTGTKPVSGRGK